MEHVAQSLRPCSAVPNNKKAKNVAKKLEPEFGIRRVVSPIEFRGELNKELFRHWSSLRVGNNLPRQDKYDHLSRPDLLATLVVADVINNGKDYQVRYLGALIAEILELGNELPMWSEIEARSAGNPQILNFISNSTRIYDRSSRERVALANGPKRLSWGPKDYIWFESLCVPFVDDMGNVTLIVGILEAEASVENENE